VEIFLRDENIWLTQDKIALLFGVQRPAITKHLKNIFESGELTEPVVSSILEHTAEDGKTYKTNQKFFATVQNKLHWAISRQTAAEIILSRADSKKEHMGLPNSGKITAEIARAFAECEFEKYRVIQDKSFESDFDKAV